MNYSNIDDILTRIDNKVLINLTNDIIPSNEVNMQKLNETIEIADDMINASLRSRYKLPLKNIPKIITQISADIVIYRLYSRRPQDVPQNYVKNFVDAINLLKEIQNGSKILEADSSQDSEKILSPDMYMCDKEDSDRRFNGRFLL